MSGLLTALVLVPIVIAALAFSLGHLFPRAMARFGALLTCVGFVAVVAITVQVARGGPVTASVGPLDLTADRLAVVLLLLVFGVSGIVQSFAVRYLAGDRRAHWFTGGAALLTGASAGLMTADGLVAMAAFWSTAGAALCLLLGMYAALPSARNGVRRTLTAFIIGDAALWAAVAVDTTAWGAVDLRNLQPGQFAGPALPVVAVLVVIAALSRSAQIPFHRWLPATLAAPTPVSALLHAGLVNAGGILLVRLAPVVSSDAARAIVVLAGTATMVYGAAVMLVKPDIKGALVNSTTAQMGFMILTCGLGLWAAAVIHLVAHGFYKATLFLSSGSAIAAHRRHISQPPVAPPTTLQRWVNLAAAAALPAVALAAAFVVVPHGTGDQAAEQALLAFAWVTGAAVVSGWLQRRPGIGGATIAAAFLIPIAVAYVAVITVVGDFIAPALPPSTMSVAAVWAITAVALGVLGLLAAVRWAPGAEGLRRALYANALSAGYIPAPGSPAVRHLPAYSGLRAGYLPGPRRIPMSH